MNVLRCLASTVMMLGCSAATIAAPKFDSSYTKLAEGCKSLLADENEGGDESWSCRGPDNLIARLDFSAADAALNAVMDLQGVEQPMEHGVMGIDTEKGVIEWRLADGVPIALIVRSTPVLFDDQGMPYRSKEQTLEIRGLNRLSGFQASVNVQQTPKANEVARQQIADAWAKQQH